MRTDKNESIVVSALRARANFGKLLRRVEDERRSLVIEKRGAPKAVLLSIARRSDRQLGEQGLTPNATLELNVLPQL